MAGLPAKVALVNCGPHFVPHGAANLLTRDAYFIAQVDRPQLHRFFQLQAAPAHVAQGLFFPHLDGVLIRHGGPGFQLLLSVDIDVVRDPAIHLEVLEHFLDHAACAGFTVKDITFSPIKGPEGNIEYLGYLQAGEGPNYTGDLKALVEQSHSGGRRRRQSSWLYPTSTAYTSLAPFCSIQSVKPPVEAPISAHILSLRWIGHSSIAFSSFKPPGAAGFLFGGRLLYLAEPDPARPAPPDEAGGAGGVLGKTSV